jgi:hypothetical protein
VMDVVEAENTSDINILAVWAGPAGRPGVFRARFRSVQTS